jgi:hypothetical protein
MNNFKEASRRGLTFKFSNGILSLNELWSVKPETIQEEGEKLAVQIEALSKPTISFGKAKAKSVPSDLLVRYAILEEVYNDLIEEREARENSKARARELAKFDALIESKEDEELNNLSKEELLKRREALLIGKV